MERTFEVETKLKLKDTLDMLCKKYAFKQVDITFKYMEEKVLYLEKGNILVISKDCLENFYLCLALITNELVKQDLNKECKDKLMLLYNCFNILSKKKIISIDIKEELINLGFKEVNIGSKQIHEINSKDLKFDFFGNDVVIGIYARCISYGCNRLYRALVYNFN